MKKKVLFIIGTLQSGGVSKSMVNLLNAWDRTTYDTSLLICCREADVFSCYLPKDIHILWNKDIEDIHSGITGITSLLRRRRVLIALGCLLRLVLSRISKSLAGELMAKMMPAQTEQYDLIVDYGGQQQLYYMVDKLKGTKKVSFFHSDYGKWPYYYKADRHYYSKVDVIFTVSPTCVATMQRMFPNCKEKILLFENIISPTVVQRQAKEDIEDKQLAKLLTILREDGRTLLVSVGHIIYDKGIDLAIKAARRLKDKGYKLTWIFIGNQDEPKWESVAKQENLLTLNLKQKNQSDILPDILFTGILPNPYPIMNKADIFCHQARFEGEGMVLTEARFLFKPIVVTNFTVVHDKFSDRINGSICQMNGHSLADAIAELIENKALRESYISYLRQHVTDNSSEVNKLYRLL